jgi:uncharacterized membrane protein
VEKYEDRIYTRGRIILGTFFGGPLAGGYLIARNYLAFGEEENVKRTHRLTILGTILFYCLIIIVPHNQYVPKVLMPSVAIFLIYWLVGRLQHDKIEMYRQNHRQIHTVWWTVSIGIAGGAITLLGLAFAALWVDALSRNSLEAKTNRGVIYEIGYDRTNISETEVENLKEGFAQTTFFDKSNARHILAEKIKQGYLITILSDQSINTNPHAVEAYVQLKTDLQNSVPGKKVYINIAVDNIFDVVTRIY